MGRKSLSKKLFFSLLGLFLIVSACLSPMGIDQLSGKPTDTLINIQAIVQQTLNAYTVIAFQATNAQILIPISTNTLTPVPLTSTPTLSPTVTATSFRDDSCYFPYFPISSDLSWDYQTRSTNLSPENFTLHFDRIDGETLSAHQAFENRNSEVIWYCTSQGLLQSQFTHMSIPGIPEGFPLETKEYSGVTFPLPEEFTRGATWRTNYFLQGNMTTEVGEMKANVDITLDNTLAAFEEVTAPFGTYPQAARVDSQVIMLIDTQIGGFSGATTEITKTISSWYVEGVGLVKTISQEQGGEVITELTSMQ